MNHISLFTGIGGIDLASEWAGFDTILQVENDPYCLKVLEKHWPTVERCTDIRSLNGRKYRGSVDLVSGGFPCQPYSGAGKRKAFDDDRDLWPEMFRIIQEVRPTWVLGENVANFINLGLDRTISNLESEGYEVQTFNIPAVAVSAWHQRARIFVVGYAEHYGPSSSKESRSITKTGNDDKEGKDQAGQPSGTGGREDYESVAYSESNKEECTLRATESIDATGDSRLESTGGGDRLEQGRTDQAMADSASERLQGKFRSQSKGDGKRLANSSKAMADSQRIGQSGQGLHGRPCNPKENTVGEASGSEYRSKGNSADWNAEPNVGRVAHGIPKRVDRLRALGNAVVPQQVYPILEAIAKIHKGEID